MLTAEERAAERTALRDAPVPSPWWAPILRLSVRATPLLVVLAGVGAAATVAVALHAYGIPRNDDWAYRQALYHLVTTGHLVGSRWGTMTLVGQLLWAAPWVETLGAHGWVPDLAVGVLAVAGLLAGYGLVRRSLSKWRALGATATLLVAPGYALATASFMTDVPALSAGLLCMAAGARSLRSASQRRAGAWLAASMLLGLWAFSIREFMICAPMAVLAVLALAPPRQKMALLAGTFLLGACTLAYLAVSRLPGDRPTILHGPSVATVRTLVAAFFTLSFLLLPVMPYLATRIVGRGRRGVGLVSAGILWAGTAGIWAWGRPGGLLVGNYLWGQGVGGEALVGGGRPPLFGSSTWAVIEVLALVCGAVVFAYLAEGVAAGLRWWSWRRRFRPPADPRSMLAVFALFYALMVAAFTAATGQALWDRYLWPLVFVGAALALSRSTSVPVTAVTHYLRPATALAGALMLVVSAMVTVGSDSFDGARWQAGQGEVAAGVPASAVDAGFEWVGAHARGPMVIGRSAPSAPAYLTWYAQMFPSFHPCVVVSASPLGPSALQLVSVRRYDQLGFAVPERLYIFRTPLKC